MVHSHIEFVWSVTGSRSGSVEPRDHEVILKKPIVGPRCLQLVIG
jgi:hypothetical protein